MSTRLGAVPGLLVIVLLAACQRPAASRDPAPVAPSPAAVGPADQLRVTDTQVGAGAEAADGKTVSVHYTGRLASGKKFDSSYDRGEPIQFVLGRKQVIPGWEQGIKGMRVGGKRTLVIPPELGYGARGAGEAIPPNSTLVFDVELVKVD